MNIRRTSLVGVIVGIVVGLFLVGWGIRGIARDHALCGDLEAKKQKLIFALDPKARTSRPVSQPNLSRAPTAPAPHFSDEERKRQSDRLRDLHQKYWKATLLLDYGKLFRALHLSASETEAVAQIWANGQMATENYRFEHGDLLAADAETPESKAAHEEIEAMGQATDQAMRQALGDSNYEHYQQYEKESGVRALADRVVMAADASGNPIAPAQAEALNRIMVTSALDETGGISTTRVSWASTSAGAQTVLSPAQQELLKTILDDRQSWTKIMRMQREAVKP